MQILERWTEPRASGNGLRSRCLAQCDCGDISEYMTDNINRGNTTKCKKCSNLSRAEKHSKHNFSCKSKAQGGKVYYTWNAMKQRCYNPSENRFKNYGGRGIKVCARWLESFDNFVADMGQPPTDDHSIERIDNNGDYCKENCRWADKVEQARNKSNNRVITHNGEALTLAEWALKTGIKRETIAKRLNEGWVVEHALSEKPDSIMTPSGSFKSLAKAAEFYGMSISGIHARIKSDKYPDWFKIED